MSELNVYTVQLAQWRKVNGAGIQLLDTTVKSGDKAFAPTWEMVRDIKENKITMDDYATKYKDLMRLSLFNYPNKWENLLAKGSIALACYCPAGVFCHRHILKCFIKHECEIRKIQFIDKGEIR